MMHLILLAVFLPVYAHEKSAAELHVMEYLDPASVQAPKSWVFPPSYTGRRSVCWLPGATTNMSFVAWVGGDTYAPGEPFGFSRSPDANGYYAVELTRDSFITPRINLVSATSDRGETREEYFVTISNRYVASIYNPVEREQEAARYRWIATNRWENAETSAAAGALTRVRVVRWLVDGTPAYEFENGVRVVLDKKFNLAQHPILTEADLLESGVFDLDWSYLKDDIVDARDVKELRLPVNNVAYLAIIGDGPVMWRSIGDSATVLKGVNQVIERKFDAAQAFAAIYSPRSPQSVAYGALPKFSWTIPTTNQVVNNLSYSMPACSYPAFQLQILPASGATNAVAAVYDSGIQPVPPHDTEGRFIWTAPVRVGTELAASTNYRWRVAIMNAKFPTPLWCEPATFSTSPAP